MGGTTSPAPETDTLLPHALTINHFHIEYVVIEIPKQLIEY